MKLDTVVVAELARIGLVTWEIEELARLSRRLQKLGERHCNGEGWEGRNSYGEPIWTDKSEKRMDKAQGNAVKKAEKIVADSLGSKWAIYHQGDPRGCALYVVDLRKLKEGQTVDSVYSSIGYPIY